MFSERFGRGISTTGIAGILIALFIVGLAVAFVLLGPMKALRNSKALEEQRQQPRQQETVPSERRLRN